ncbi:MAG: virulence RhuM family protein [Flavobacteriales bacterium]
MQETNFLLYTTPSGDIRLDVVLMEESIWLSQKTMAELFSVGVPAISKHLSNIFESGELQKKQVVSKMETTTQHGAIAGKTQTKLVDFYNLDAIISVGYRVNSAKATQFRIWATKTLKEYIIKGFTVDDERLKQGKTLFGKDYFKELLERVRSIRASERRIYQQVTDIFAECSIDYDRQSPITKKFYAVIQNKFHFAITGKTAAEIIYLKADSKKENMGLTSWKNAPTGRIIKSDTSIAKNYLEEKEIKQLERTVTSYFDYIEGLIERENTFTMEQLALSVNKFLEFNEYKVLEGLGRKSKKQAEKKAYLEYDKFNKIQKIESDFDKMVKKLKNKK